MKNLILLFSAILIFTNFSYTQSPQAFKYQTVVRDAIGDIIGSQAVSFQISIRDVSAIGTILYQETHTTTTNQYGLANIEIGNGIQVSGVFADIDWGTNSKFLEVGLDPDGGNTFTLMGTAELASVPYALYAENAGNNDDGDWTIDANTLYSAADSTVTIKDSNVGIGTISPITSLHVNGKGAFGNSVISSKATRALNLISTDAVMRIWRVTDNTTLAPGVELVWGNQPNHGDDGNFWWDFYLDGLTGNFNLRDRSFGQGSAARFTIDTSGNVGIGTTQPDRKLHIAGDMKIEEMEIGSFSNSLVTWDNTDSTLKRILPSAINDTDWTVAGSDMYATVSGNVGIGITTPLTPLHVHGRGAFGNAVNSTKANRALNLISSDAVMRIWRVTDNTAFDPGVELVWGNQPAQGDDGNFWWDFYLKGSDGSFNIRDRSFGQDNQTRMKIDAFGNVGLGTINPDEKLHVAGALKLEDMSFGSLSDSLVTWDPADSTLKVIAGCELGKDYDWTIDADTLYSAVDSTITIKSGSVGIGTTNPGVPFVIMNGADTLFKVVDGQIRIPGNGQTEGIAFMGDYGKGSTNIVNGIFRPAPNTQALATGSQERLRITSTGEIGIGTIEPLERLDVNGGVRIGFSTNNNAGTIRWTGSQMEFNDGSLWLPLEESSPPPLWAENGPDIHSINPGMVGIGTPTPTHTLDVMGEARIEIMNLNNTLESMVVADPLGVLHLRDASTLGGFAFSEHVTIAENGNLGIGTDSPTAKAHIKDVLRLEPRSSYPQNPNEGDIFVHAYNHNIYCYLNGTWQQLNNK